MINIIEKKKRGLSLEKDEIEYFISGVVSKKIPEYQTSALLMAIYFQGMNIEETTNLTLAMANSGDRADLSGIKGIKVDKHSTGGVGDSTTMIAAPLVAACGGVVAKMSGRGLGHTGGTLDKLMSIPDMRVLFGSDEFLKLVKKNNLAVVGQTENLAHADKILYALRDVTSTIDNMSLISSSIMSKKIAGGCDALVLDVKYGSGSFMKTFNDALKLSEMMIGIGKGAGLKTHAVLSDMNEPLGRNIGNALEVREVIKTLKGENMDSRLLEVSLEIASHMLVLSILAKNTKKAKSMLESALNNGSGLQKFKDMISAQGGDIRAVDNPELLPAARSIIDIKSDKAGKILSMDISGIGKSAMLLGAGRAKKIDEIDSAVGLIMNCRLNDEIKCGDVLCFMHVNDDKNQSMAAELFNDSINVG